MMRLNMSIFLIHLTTSASITLAVTYNVPPDDLPLTLNSGDILNFDPRDHSDFNVPVALPVPPTGSTVNIYSSNFHEFVTHPGNPLEGALNVFGGHISGFLATRNATIAVSEGGTISLMEIDQETTVNVHGGRVNELYMRDSTINVTAGTTGLLLPDPNATFNTINMSGGLLDIVASFQPLSNIEFNMSGGHLSYLEDRIHGDAALNMSGGTISNLTLSNGATFKMSGGAVAVDQYGTFVADHDSIVHVFVQQIQVDGMNIPGLVPGLTVPYDLTDRAGELTGVLADGSPFQFELVVDLDTQGILHERYPGRAFIVTAPIQSPTFEVLITLVPEPSALTLGMLSFTCGFACQQRVLRRRKTIA